MCDQQTRKLRESQIQQEAASMAINKTIKMFSRELGIPVPNIGTPSDRREILIQTIRARLIALGP